MQTTTSTGDDRIPTEDVGAAIRHTINVADQTLTYRQVGIDDFTLTGAQLAIAAGFKSVDGVSVLQVLATGDLEDVQHAHGGSPYWPVIAVFIERSMPLMKVTLAS